jgi:hypothetical protein
MAHLIKSLTAYLDITNAIPLLLHGIRKNTSTRINVSTRMPMIYLAILLNGLEQLAPQPPFADLQ